MRQITFFAGIVLLLAACSLPFGNGAQSDDEEFDIARMNLSEEDERPGPVLGHEERMRLVRKRFPGVDELDLVRVVVWPKDRRGPCWSEVAPPKEMKVSAGYGLDGEWGDAKAGDLPTLLDQGWRGIYRTPSGTGFERRASFEHIDLTVETEFLCTCYVGGQGKTETIRRPVRLRLRWQGEGHMPEVSGRSVKEDRTIGLKTGISSGTLLTYEFPVREEYPRPQPNRCGGTAAFQLLVDPPMM